MFAAKGCVKIFVVDILPWVWYNIRCIAISINGVCPDIRKVIKETKKVE